MKKFTYTMVILLILSVSVITIIDLIILKMIIDLVASF